MSSTENETGVELIIIITWWCHIENKSQRIGVNTKNMRPETLSIAPQYLKLDTFQSAQCLSSSKGLQIFI